MFYLNIKVLITFAALQFLIALNEAYPELYSIYPARQNALRSQPLPQNPSENLRNTFPDGLAGVAGAFAIGAKAIVHSGMTILKHIVGVDPPQEVIHVYPDE